MATSVLLACGLNEPKPAQFLFISEQSGVDGSFLISSILGQRLKIQNSGTILICLHNTYQHYSNSSMRLGFNISTSLNKGTLKVIEPMTNINEQLFDSKFLTNPTDLLDSFWSTLVETIEQFKDTSCINLIIDDVSAMLNLGAGSEIISQFSRRLKELSTTNSSLAIVLKLNACNVYKNLTSYIGDLADLRIEVERLRSGNFREVDGKLVLMKHPMFRKEMLYKVNDRNVKVFAPGEVGVKV